MANNTKSKKTTRPAAVPADVKQPSDYQAGVEELAKRSIDVEFEGVTYTMLPGAAENIELIEAIEDEKYITAVRSLYGKTQYQAWKDANRDENGIVTADTFERFLDATMEAIGGGQGN